MFSAVAEAAALTPSTTRPNTQRGDDARAGETFSSMIDSNLNAADNGSPAPAPAPRRLSSLRGETTNPAHSSARSTPATNGQPSTPSPANSDETAMQSTTSSLADANEESHTEAATAETTANSATPPATATPNGETSAALPASTLMAAPAAVFLLPDQITVKAPGEPAGDEQISLFGPPPATVSDKLPMVSIPEAMAAPGNVDAVLVDAAATTEAEAAGASLPPNQSAAATAAEGADDAAIAARTAAATAGAIPARNIPVIAAAVGTASVTSSAMAATSGLEPRVQNGAPADDAKGPDTPTTAADARAAAILASTPRPQPRTATPATAATRDSAAGPALTAVAPEVTEKSASTDTGLLPAETPPEPRAHTVAAPSTSDKPSASAVAAQAAPASDPALLQVANNQPQATPAQAFTALTAVASNAQPFATPAAEQAVPLAGVAAEIAARAKGGTSRFDIRLDPPELGRVDVRMNVDSNGQVTTHLVVERAETLDLLRRDAPQLQQALQDSGLKTGDSALQFSLRDQSQRQTPNDSAEPAVKLVIQPEDTLPPEIAGRSYGRMPSASGGLDIRV